MVVKDIMDTDIDLEDSYKFERKSGRNIIERCPVFSPDGESIAVIVQNIVRVYNIETGDCARVLETENEANELIAIQFPENEHYNLYGCSDKGCVTIWTWDKGAVLREVKLNIPNGAQVLSFDLVDNTECFVTAKNIMHKNVHVATYSIKTGAVMYVYNNTRPLYYDMVRVSLGWCNGDRFAAITNGTKVLFIQNLYKPHLRCEIINNGRFRIIAVAAHSKDSAVAITDTLGVTTIIRGNLYDYRSVAKEILHWHFLPPLAVSFTLQGNYLLTGGMEKVLVKWTIGNLANKAFEKTFIPRLPGIIRFIATNNTHIALSLTNNSIVIANAQMRVVSTILECGGLSPAAQAIGTSLEYHRQLDALLMSGRSGHLQLYSANTNKVLYNIDITEMNTIPPERRNLLPLEVEVTCAAVSADGNWLATSEYRNDGINYPEEKLKFWSLQKKNHSPFNLNTCINMSHNGCNVVSLAFNSNAEFCVSAGNDQKFRIWKKEKNPKKHWICFTACYYSSGDGQFLSHDILNTFKNRTTDLSSKVEDLPYMKDVDENDVVLKIFNVHKQRNLLDESIVNAGMRKDPEADMGGVAISHDGSLIAAWFGCKLTLWDTHVCTLKTVLSHPAMRPKGVHVKFGNQDTAHYLVCTTSKCIIVWSLLSLTVKWIVKVNPTYLAADPHSNKMTVVTSNNDVFVFSPLSPTPILSKKRILQPHSGVFRHCTFGHSTKNEIRLFVMRNDTEIYSIEPKRAEKSSLEGVSALNLPVSRFGALVAELRPSAARAQPARIHAALPTDAPAAVAQFLSAAPHMVPPVNVLCTAFLHQISGKKSSEEHSETQDVIMEVDPNSSDDDEDIKPQNKSPGTNDTSEPATVQLWAPNYEKIKEKRLKKILTEPFLDLSQISVMFDL